MNSLPNLDRTLELLGRVRDRFESFTAAIREADLEVTRESAKLERQLKHARQQFEERRDVSLAETQAAFEAAKAGLETRTRKRQSRITRARTSAQAMRLKGLVSREARQVFQVQRELLQTTRNRDASIQQADAQLAAFIEQWNLAGEQWSALEQLAMTAFRGYPGLRRDWRARRLPLPNWLRTRTNGCKSRRI